MRTGRLWSSIPKHQKTPWPVELLAVRAVIAVTHVCRGAGVWERRTGCPSWTSTATGMPSSCLMSWAQTHSLVLQERKQRLVQFIDHSEDSRKPPRSSPYVNQQNNLSTHSFCTIARGLFLVAFGNCVSANLHGCQTWFWNVITRVHGFSLEAAQKIVLISCKSWNINNRGVIF